MVVARLPVDESIVRPRSRCPACKTAIAWYDNIPLLSWVLLRARCRHCGSPIAARYPLIEALNAALWLALYAELGVGFSLILWLPLSSALLALVFLDIDHFWVPDVITIPAMFWALAWSLAPGGLRWVDALVGLTPALALWLFAWIFERVAGREGMGLGDVKLLAVVGLALGAPAALWVLVLASLQGAVIGSLVVWRGGHRPVQGPEPSPPTARQDGGSTPTTVELAPSDDDWQPHPRAVPFGPFIVLAVFEVVLLPDLVGAARDALLRGLGASP